MHASCTVRGRGTLAGRPGASTGTSPCGSAARWNPRMVRPQLVRTRTARVVCTNVDRREEAATAREVCGSERRALATPEDAAMARQACESDPRALATPAEAAMARQACRSDPRALATPDDGTISLDACESGSDRRSPGPMQSRHLSRHCGSCLLLRFSWRPSGRPGTPAHTIRSVACPRSRRRPPAPLASVTACSTAGPGSSAAGPPCR